MDTTQPGQMAVDILELNRLRHSLVIGSHVWDRQLYSMDSLLKRNSISKATQANTSFVHLKELMGDSLSKDGRVNCGQEEIACESLKLHESTENGILSDHKEPVVPLHESFVPEVSMVSCHHNRHEELSSDGEITVTKTTFECFPSHESTLSDKIDSAWTGTDHLLVKAQPVHVSNADGCQAASVRQPPQSDSPPFRRLKMPVRVHSFDSAVRVQERMRKGLPPSSLHMSNLRSFHASGEYRSMVRDPLSNVMRTYSHTPSLEAQKMNLLLSSTPTLISSASQMAEGVRLLLPQTGQSDMVIAVYDNEPTSIISYALSCKEYDGWVADKSHEHEGGWSANENIREDSAASTFSAWHSFGSIDLDYIHYGSYGTEDASSSMSSLFADAKKSPHLRISFGDESSSGGGKVKFSVTCYLAKQFDSLRKKCCPSEVDFVRSLSRCRRWSAQGGKSNVYFAKSLDERFIIKQVTKTELESFEEFAPEYFKYLTHSLSSGSPTCLAKVLGIYQVRPNVFACTLEGGTLIFLCYNSFFID